MTLIYSDVRSHLVNFLKNTKDTCGNRYRHNLPLCVRLANQHHFMRLINRLLPNEMPHMRTGSYHGITKIIPNHITLSSNIDGSIVRGTVWLNTKHESDCVRNRLQMLEHWNIEVYQTYRVNGSNHIVSFDLKCGAVKADAAIPGVSDMYKENELVDAIPVVISKRAEDKESVDTFDHMFDSDELFNAILCVRGSLMAAQNQINDIDEQIEQLKNKRNTLIKKVKTIKVTIGA